MTLSAIPPGDPGRAQHLDEGEPADLDLERRRRRPPARGPATATSIAFTPCHGRAEWALSPRKTTVAFRLPRQPAWIALSVGSSIDDQVGLEHERRLGEDARQRALLGRQLLADEEEEREVARERRLGRPPSAASSTITATPPFMSLAPRPTTQPSSIRPGRLSCARHGVEVAGEEDERPAGPLRSRTAAPRRSRR